MVNIFIKNLLLVHFTLKAVGALTAAFPLLIMGLKKKNFRGILSLARTTVSKLTGSSTYNSPVPSLSSITSMADDLQQAIANLGEKGNRGSHADVLDCEQKAYVLFIGLKSLLNYCTATAQQVSGTDPVALRNLLAETGFALKKTGTPQGIVGKVQGITSVRSRGLNNNQVDWRWKRPLEVTSPDNVKIYKVYKSETNSFAAALLVATTSEARYVDTNSESTQVTAYFWFSCETAEGESQISDSVSITLPGVI